MDFSALLKMLVESPALQGMIMSALGQAWLKFASAMNAKGVASNLKVWLHPAYIVMSFIAYMLDGLDKGSLNTDPNMVQNILTLYANTLVIHTVAEKAKDKVGEAKSKSLPVVEAKPADSQENK